MSEDEDWIRGRETFHLMIKGGSIGTAAARLREPCARGRIRARALDGTLTLRHGHGKKVVQDWDVPKEVWAGGFNNSSFQLNEGMYTSADFGTGYNRVELSGLLFSRADIIAYFGIDNGDPTSSVDVGLGSEYPAPSRPGRGVDTDKWGTLLASIVALQHQEGIDLAWTASAFHDRLKGFIAERGGSDSDIPHYSKCSKALTRALWWAAGHKGEPDT